MASSSMWDEGAVGRRPYRMKVETASFEIKCKKDGTPINYGEDVIMALEVSGPMMLLDRDDFSDDEEAKTPDDSDYPVQKFDVGPGAEFSDEDEDGKSVVAMKTAMLPRSRFELGQVLRSLKDLVGMDWLDDNFGEWNIAENWVGHEIVFYPESVVDEDGEVVKRGEYPVTFTRVLSIDGHDGDDKKKKKKKK